MNRYDIYLADVSWTNPDGTIESKVRPVMIYDTISAIPLSHPITSHQARPNYSGDYTIVKWREAGLRVPSTLRMDIIIDNINGVILRQIGRLDEYDIQRIEDLLQRIRLRGERP